VVALTRSIWAQGIITTLGGQSSGFGGDGGNAAQASFSNVGSAGVDG
jgi:hypothetical protein